MDPRALTAIPGTIVEIRMSLATRRTHPRWRVLLLTAAGACLTLMLSQCRMVGDKVLGPEDGLSGSASSRSGSCISACARAYADSITAESQIHVVNIQACGGDTNCEWTENTRHILAVARINTGRVACMDACHHQGGGIGGR